MFGGLPVSSKCLLTVTESQVTDTISSLRSYSAQSNDSSSSIPLCMISKYANSSFEMIAVVLIFVASCLNVNCFRPSPKLSCCKDNQRICRQFNNKLYSYRVESPEDPVVTLRKIMVCYIFSFTSLIIIRFH